jgi:hypothetical protein
MVPRTVKRRFIQPTLYRDSARGMRERFRNRNKTLDRKVLDMHKKCRTHAIKIVQHPRTGKLDVFDTKKGSGTEWPPALHSFVSQMPHVREDKSLVQVVSDDLSGMDSRPRRFRKT